ncbi:hypothetical protein [Mesorhizobium argentiipisi]|uniref:Uncharacterized protein n=1 Tax=Mesorhizobium argentiipisi TaxID=3015175 RepID=A0ABU8KLQ2_9HYPH
MLDEWLGSPRGRDRDEFAGVKTKEATEERNRSSIWLFENAVFHLSICEVMGEPLRPPAMEPTT